MSSTIIGIPSARWGCKTAALSSQGSPLESGLTEELTVGTRFALVCEGESAALVRDKVSLRMAEKESYTLKLLDVRELTPNRSVLIVTTYKVGNFEVQGATLDDGETSVALDGISLSVVSVINPTENPEGKPFAPVGPMAVTWPVWIWIVFGAIALTILFTGIRAWRASSRRRKFLSELAQTASQLSAYQQFNKDLRAIGREFPLASPHNWNSEIAGKFMEELDGSFRRFLAREFVVPVLHERNPTKILRLLRREEKRNPALRLEKPLKASLSVALREIRRGLAEREKISAPDGQQLVDLCRKVADGIQTRHRERAE